MQIGWTAEFFRPELYYEGNKVLITMAVLIEFSGLYLAAGASLTVSDCTISNNTLIDGADRWSVGDRRDSLSVIPLSTGSRESWIGFTKRCRL